MIRIRFQFFMGVLKCTHVSINYWNFIKLQQECELVWLLRQEQLDLKQNCMNADLELIRYCILLEQSLDLCTAQEQFTLKKRQLDGLNMLLFEFNLGIQYCNCWFHCRVYLMFILFQIFNFGILKLHFPDYVLDLFQDILKAFTGEKSQEIELIRKEQNQL